MKCSKCQNDIGEDRIAAYIDLFGINPETCINCGPKGKPLVFMGPEGKTGAGHINIVQPDDPQLSRVKLWHRRGANHCSSG